MAAEVYFTGVSDAWGAHRVAMGYVTVSGLVSGACQLPGVGKILGGSVSLRSHTAETSFTVSWNQNSAASTGYDGWIRIASAVAGDIFDVVAWA